MSQARLGAISRSRPIRKVLGFRHTGRDVFLGDTQALDDYRPVSDFLPLPAACAID